MSPSLPRVFTVPQHEYDKKGRRRSERGSGGNSLVMCVNAPCGVSVTGG